MALHYRESLQLSRDVDNLHIVVVDAVFGVTMRPAFVAKRKSRGLYIVDYHTEVTLAIGALQALNYGANIELAIGQLAEVELAILDLCATQ